MPSRKSPPVGLIRSTAELLGTTPRGLAGRFAVGWCLSAWMWSTVYSLSRPAMSETLSDSLEGQPEQVWRKMQEERVKAGLGGGPRWMPPLRAGRKLDPDVNPKDAEVAAKRRLATEAVLSLYGGRGLPQGLSYAAVYDEGASFEDPAVALHGRASIEACMGFLARFCSAETLQRSEVLHFEGGTAVALEQRWGGDRFGFTLPEMIWLEWREVDSGTRYASHRIASHLDLWGKRANHLASLGGACHVARSVNGLAAYALSSACLALPSFSGHSKGEVG